MDGFWKLRVAALLLAAALPAAAWSPLGFSLGFDGMGGSRPDVIGFPERDGAVYGFRLILFGGATDTMYGIAVAGLANGGDGSGIGKDYAEGDIAGFEIAGLVNVATSSRFGAWQVSGLQNKLLKGGDIVQMAAFYNEIGGEASGIQIAGIENKAKGDFTGLQIAGVFNRAQGTLSGVQIAAVNVANKLRGVQIGAINCIDVDCVGVQIGAVNICNGSQAEFLPVLRISF